MAEGKKRGVESLSLELCHLSGAGAGHLHLCGVCLEEVECYLSWVCLAGLLFS